MTYDTADPAKPTIATFNLLDTSSPCTNCEIDNTFNLDIKAEVGGSEVTYTIIRLVTHLC